MKSKNTKSEGVKQILRGELESLIKATAELKQRLEANVDILQDEIGELKRSADHSEDHNIISAEFDNKLEAMEKNILSKLVGVSRPLRENIEEMREEIEELKANADTQEKTNVRTLVENRLAGIKQNSQNFNDIQSEINMLVKDKLQELEVSAASAQKREMGDIDALKSSLEGLRDENMKLKAELSDLRKTKLEELKNIYKKLPVVVQ